jgi:protein-L-isoaspartate(D-aspartate) O-methyltransferase
MVEEQLIGRRIRDERVLEAMGRIERHRFVPPAEADNAYGDFPVALGEGQTLSQPYVVALMTQALELEGCEKVLEIGTGSGYQTAVLAELVRKVFTVEVLAELATTAKARLQGLGYDNIRYRIGNGREGWPERAPFDRILVAAASRELPPGLRDQLSPAGRLVIPVGPADLQELEVHERATDAPAGFEIRRLGAVRFVPLV